MKNGDAIYEVHTWDADWKQKGYINSGGILAFASREEAEDYIARNRRPGLYCQLRIATFVEPKPRPLRQFPLQVKR